MPADETDAVTFVGALGIEYCSAEVAAGATAIADAMRAKAPRIEIFFFIVETFQHPFNRGLIGGEFELNITAVAG